jgi:hypothetical protein
MDNKTKQEQAKQYLVDLAIAPNIDRMVSAGIVIEIRDSVQEIKAMRVAVERLISLLEKEKKEKKIA